MSQNTTIIDHPLIRHKLSKVRDKNTNTKDFRELISEIGGLMAYEITRNLETVPKMIETPIATAQVEVLAKDIVIIPIYSLSNNLNKMIVLTYGSIKLT